MIKSRQIQQVNGGLMPALLIFSPLIGYLVLNVINALFRGSIQPLNNPVSNICIGVACLIATATMAYVNKEANELLSAGSAASIGIEVPDCIFC